MGGPPGQAAWQWRCRESHMALWKSWDCLREPQEGILGWVLTAALAGLPVRDRGYKRAARGPGGWNSYSLHLKPGKQLKLLNRSGQGQTGALSKNLLENHGSWWGCSSTEYVFLLQINFSIFFRVKEGNSCPSFYYLLLLEGASPVNHKTPLAGRSAAGALWVRTTLWDGY